MRTAVKPPQAFFLAARTNRAAGLVPIFARGPALFHSMLSPRRRPPPAGVRGGRRRGESMLRCAIDARPSVGPVVANSFGSVGVLGGPGTAPGRPSIRGGPAKIPSTFYRVRPWRPARHLPEPTHRTNGALTGSPGGTTAALSDLAYPPAAIAATSYSPSKIGALRCTSGRRLRPSRPLLLSRAAGPSS